MHANGEQDGNFQRRLDFFESRRQRQSVHGAMNPQRKHHRRGEFGQPMRRGLVEMTGRARRADMKNVFGDDGKKEIARSRHRQQPPAQVFPTFRRDAAERDAQQCSGAEADEGAKLSVRPGQKTAERAAGHRDGERRENLGQNRSRSHVFNCESFAIYKMGARLQV
jgi:hypothetical protein